MTGRTTEKSGSELIGKLIASVGMDLLAAWALMRGLNDLHVSAGYLACLLICAAAHTVIGNSAR